MTHIQNDGQELSFQIYHANYKGLVIVALCTLDGRNVFVTYSVYASQDEVPIEFFNSIFQTSMLEKIDKFCAKNNFELYSY